MVRKGSAGSNTAADHLAVLDDAISALPPQYRRRLMVTADGAGASHALITKLDKLAARPGHSLIYSVGWELGGRERAALKLVPEAAWQIAIGLKGQVRERRADAACRDASCCHRECWVEEAHVTELTGILRPDTGHDQLSGWPETMRIFARRERPHPGAQLTLLEAEDGYRYVLQVTNLPARTRGWRANPAYIDAVHRVHARVDDGIRTGKDTGIGRFPSHDFAFSTAWLAASLIAATLLAWLKLIASTARSPGPSPRPCVTRSCTPPRASSGADAAAYSRYPPPGPGPTRSQPPGRASPQSHTRPDPRRVPCPCEPSQHEDHGSSGHPARQPGSLSCPATRIKINYQASWPSHTSDQAP